MKYSGIGGQAVLEGIMMMNRSKYAVAVRRPGGGIALMKDEYHSITEKSAILRLPFIRGVFRFADSMIVGMKTLNYSAEIYAEEEGEPEEPSAFEKFLDRIFGEKLEKMIMGAVMVFSFVAASGIFMVLPLLIAGIFRRFIPSHSVMAFLEGLIRVAIFITYKNVRKSSKEHKRCGTSFLLIVMMISIIVFMIVRVDTIGMRILSRIVLVPVIAGISYEVLQKAGRSSSKLSDIVAKPGLCMQALTTTEPDDSMIEVAITATEAVFDWKAYLRENFPDTVIPEETAPAQEEFIQEASGSPEVPKAV